MPSRGCWPLKHWLQPGRTREHRGRAAGARHGKRNVAQRCRTRSIRKRCRILLPQFHNERPKFAKAANVTGCGRVCRPSQDESDMRGTAILCPSRFHRGSLAISTPSGALPPPDPFAINTANTMLGLIKVTSRCIKRFQEHARARLRAQKVAPASQLHPLTPQAAGALLGQNAGLGRRPVPGAYLSHPGKLHVNQRLYRVHPPQGRRHHHLRHVHSEVLINLLRGEIRLWFYVGQTTVPADCCRPGQNQQRSCGACPAKANLAANGRFVEDRSSASAPLDANSHHQRQAELEPYEAAVA